MTAPIITTKQFDKARQFIYRHGDLLTRKRFAYQFEGLDKQAVLNVLACYQNEDGGFGNGVELDLLCPDSSGIGMEMALGYLLELDVTDGPVLHRAMEWMLTSRTENGDLPHPTQSAKAYPHGNWWEQDAGRVLSVAGLLGRAGITLPEIRDRAAAVFEANYMHSPQEIRIYSYPIALYLRYADGANRYAESRSQLEAAFPAMMEKDAWHHPLFFLPYRWDSPDIPASVWRAAAERAVGSLKDDGGVSIEQYANLPWWRPVWTLDMLVAMKNNGLLGNVG